MVNIKVWLELTANTKKPWYHAGHVTHVEIEINSQGAEGKYWETFLFIILCLQYVVFDGWNVQHQKTAT